MAAGVGADAGAGTRPLADELVVVARNWADCQYRLVVLSAAFADSTEWVTQAPTAAHWLASVAE